MFLCTQEHFRRQSISNLGAILGPSWALLGPPWGHLGAILGHLGAILGHLGAILGHRGPLEAQDSKIVHKSCVFTCFLHSRGGPLSNLGAILGPSWALLGPPRGHFGAILGHLGAILGHLGAILDHHGPLETQDSQKVQKPCVLAVFWGRAGEVAWWGGGPLRG